jgi:hypothetical protein
LIEFNLEPEELSEAEPEPVAEAKPVELEPEPAALGQANTVWWTLGFIAVATLAGGGLLLLRRSGN